jgi:uridine kinase
MTRDQQIEAMRKVVKDMQGRKVKEPAYAERYDAAIRKAEQHIERLEKRGG